MRKPKRSPSSIPVVGRSGSSVSRPRASSAPGVEPDKQMRSARILKDIKASKAEKEDAAIALLEMRK